MTPARSLSLLVGIAYLGFVLIGAMAGAGGVLLPSQISDYQVNKSIIGLLFLGFSIGYFLSSTNAGILSQKLGPFRYLTIGAVILFISSLLVSLRPSFLVLIILEAALGFGAGSIDAGFNSIVAALPQSGQRLNYLHGFFGVGALLGPLVTSTLLTQQWPWQRVYLVWGVLSFLLVLGCLLLVRFEPLPVSGNSGEQKGEGNLLRATLRLGTAWLGAIFLFLYVGIEISIGSWNYSFSLEARHLDPFLAGWVASGYWFGLTLGRFLVNTVSARFHIGSVTIIYACLVGIDLGLILIWFLPGTLAVSCGFILIGVFLGPIFPATIAIMPEAVPAPLVSSAIGLLVGASVVGGALFPTITGTLAQSFGIWTLLPVILTLTVVMCPVWWQLTYHLRNTAS